MRYTSVSPEWCARQVLWIASLLVPRADRTEWAREWTAELWHFCHAPHAGAPRAQWDGLAFASGAFSDAWWLACDHLLVSRSIVPHKGSAARCRLLLASCMLAGFLFCLASPGARRAFLPHCFGDGSDLVTISSRGFAGAEIPTIPVASYREWRSDATGVFTAIAFYRPVLKGVHVAGFRTAHLAMVLASPNLLAMLHLSDPGLPSGHPQLLTLPRLFLTRSTFRQHYGERQILIGSTAIIAGEPVQIAGVLPADGWPSLGHVDAVLLESERSMDAMNSNARGFVIASIRPSVTKLSRQDWRRMVDTRNGEVHQYDCISLTFLAIQPLKIFLFALLLAGIALPATTPLQLGEYPRNAHRGHSTGHLRRWRFLATKLVLSVLAVYFWSILLAYGCSSARLTTSIYIQLATAFPALLFVFRWSLHDQRNRCPECMRLLTHPARVGQPSCNFLAWNGTELICAVGHGLLHIPELPTSWFGTQRWLSLDSSWICLFRDSGAPAAGSL